MSCQSLRNEIRNAIESDNRVDFNFNTTTKALTNNNSDNNINSYNLMDAIAKSTFPSTSITMHQPISSRTRTKSDAKSELEKVKQSQQPFLSWSDSWKQWLNSKIPYNNDDPQKYLNENDKSIDSRKGNLKSKYDVPKNALVFCHGLLGFDLLGPTNLPALQISHWRGICEYLQENGVKVLVTRVPSTSSVEDRAKVLDDQISKSLPGQDVNLIGHSMGGLDCRHLASHMNPTKYNIVSITTISTPHRGSSFADYMIDEVIGRDNLPNILSKLPNRVVPLFSGDGKAFEGLTTRAMEKFNEQTPDLPTIKYFSYAARHDPNSIFDTFRFPWGIIVEREGENDGLVSVRSARWGEFKGVIEYVV